MCPASGCKELRRRSTAALQVGMTRLIRLYEMQAARASAVKKRVRWAKKEDMAWANKVLLLFRHLTHCSISRCWLGSVMTVSEFAERRDKTNKHRASDMKSFLE